MFLKDISVYGTDENALVEVVQWDTDVVACIRESDIKKAYKVHFFNLESDVALAVQGVYENNMLKVKIPNKLLWQPYTILGYVQIEESGEGKGTYRFRINMRKRPQPSNYFYGGTKDYIEATEILKECKAEAVKSNNSAINSKSWAIGGTGTRTNENIDNAKYHSQQSKTFSNTASTKATEAATSANAAKVSETNAKTSETNAKVSETAAKTSETNAASSKTAAANSATAAANSANTASTKATEASNSASAAKTSETNAKKSETAAKTSETNATSSKTAAANSATAAANSANTASTKATEASNSASAASTKATEATNSAINSKSWAIGGTGTRTNENIDNAKYYYEQSKTLAKSFSGALRPMGTVAFANLPAVANASEGDMYNISNQFTTDTNFKEGAGHVITAGANVYKTADGKWDILAGIEYPLATTTANGLMSKEDKAKLDTHTHTYIKELVPTKNDNNEVDLNKLIVGNSVGFWKIDSRQYTVLNAPTTSSTQGLLVAVDFENGGFGEQYFSPYSSNTRYFRSYYFSVLSSKVVFGSWYKIFDGTNAAAALQLANARKINGVGFDGTADVTITAAANGGNAQTVNGHTVLSDVPANAKYTDTTYSAATATADGLMSKEDKRKLDTYPATFSTVKGEKGDKGDKGATGARGSIWHTGTNVTGSSYTAGLIGTEEVNDMYLNTSTGEIFQCTEVSNQAKWVRKCKLNLVAKG